MLDAKGTLFNFPSFSLSISLSVLRNEGKGDISCLLGHLAFGKKA